MSDVTATAGLVAYLAADTVLQGLAPGGVWEDPAPQSQASVPPVVVTVDLQTGNDQPCGGGRGWTECWYAVKAVGVAAQIATVRQAASRIDALLENNPSLLVNGVSGWRVQKAQRQEPIEYPDPEPTTGLRFEHRGGIYRIDVEAV